MTVHGCYSFPFNISAFLFLLNILYLYVIFVFIHIYKIKQKHEILSLNYILSSSILTDYHIKIIKAPIFFCLEKNIYNIERGIYRRKQWQLFQDNHTYRYN